MRTKNKTADEDVTDAEYDAVTYVVRFRQSHASDSLQTCEEYERRKCAVTTTLFPKMSRN